MEERSKFKVLLISKDEKIPYAVAQIESENQFEKRKKYLASLC